MGIKRMSDNEPPNELGEPAIDDLLSLSEAAERCGLSASHLRLLVRNGEIWGKKLGRNWVTTEGAVKVYLARNPKPGPKPAKGT